MKKLKKVSILLLTIATLTATTACDFSSKKSDTTPTSDNSTNNVNDGTNANQSNGDSSSNTNQGNAGTGTNTEQGSTTTPSSGDGNTTTPSSGESSTTTPSGDNTQGQESGSTQEPSGGDTPTQQITKYEVTFETNGGSSITKQDVESGKTIPSVTTTKTGCKFTGWYTDSSLTQAFDVTTPVTGNLKLYAQWSATVTFETNSGTTVTEQTVVCGNKITDVTTSRNGYDFAGWFTDAALKTAFNTSTPITTNITLYAKWTIKVIPGNILKESKAYNEGAYVVFEVSDATAASNSTVSYSQDGTNWTSIDSNLIRYDDTSKTARADILGLMAGSYLVKVNNTENVSTTSTLNVSADDRSGYAHFKNTNGVGAYKDDGTLKSNAVVVYVTEATKNSVQVTIGSKTYTGLYNILSNSNANYPLDVRILGDIGSPTLKSTNTTVSKLADKNYDVKVMNSSGTVLSSTIEEKTDGTKTGITSGGYGTYDNSYPTLNGLTSKIIYDTKTYNGTTYKDYDSYFNMMDISGKSNITVEGIGVDATITQWGFTWKNCNYIEVKNLTFNNYPEDACSFEGSDTSATTLSGLTTGNLWVHNNTFNIGKNNWDVSYEQDKHEGDGATDFKGLKNVTVSYNHYYKNHKTGLVGGDGKHHQANFTFHHNWYQENQARLPYGRQANMHMYNNFYDSSTGTNMQIHDGAYAFIENCYFKNTAKTFEVKKNKTDQAPAIKSYNNIFDGCGNYNIDLVTHTTNREATVTSDCLFGTSFDTDSSLFYYENNATKVTIMNQASELPTLIPTIAGAGVLPNFNLGTFNNINTDTNVETFTVNFETNDGTSITSQTVETGAKISTVSTTRDGYTFNGWSTKEDLSDSFDVNTPITNSLTLNAKWTKNTSSQTTNTVITFNDFTTGTFSSSTTLNGVTLTTKSGKTSEIKSITSTTVGGNTISKYVTFAGGGSYSEISVQFTTSATSSITVYYAGKTNNGVGRKVSLYNSNGLILTGTTESTGEGVDKVVSHTFTNVEAGNYAITSSNSSIEIYAIIINYLFNN